jgi:hypothetical protein
MTEDYYEDEDYDGEYENEHGDDEQFNEDDEQAEDVDEGVGIAAGNAMVADEQILALRAKLLQDRLDKEKNALVSKPTTAASPTTQVQLKAEAIRPNAFTNPELSAAVKPALKAHENKANLSGSSSSLQVQTE